MSIFLQTLKQRNKELYYYGWVCFVFAIIFLGMSWVSSTQVYNVSAWYKPFKFAFSTFLYAWAMAWYCFYLPNFNQRRFNLSVIVLLGLEILYIAIQAGRGQLSHYHIINPFYGFLYVMMAFAASCISLYTAYIANLFCKQSFPTLPSHYVWAIRLGLILFVIFSFEGFVMGVSFTHTIGGPNGEASIPILNWSTKYGDPRIAHFIGMHALQVLPLASYYVFKNTKTIIVVSLLYGLLAVFTLIQALNGQPFISVK